MYKEPTKKKLEIELPKRPPQTGSDGGYGAPRPTQPYDIPYTPPPVSVNANINKTNTNKNSLLNSLMSPEAIAAMAVGGLGIGSNIMNNRADARENQLNRDMRMRELMAGMAGDDQNDARTRQIAYLDSTQMDPVKQQRDLFSANLLADIARTGPQHIVPGQGNVNPAHVSDNTMGFMAPDALASAASRFYGAAGSVDPHQAHPDLAGMGFGAAGTANQTQMDQTINDAGARAEAMSKARRDALLGTIDTSGGTANGDIQNAQGTTLHNPDPSRYQWDANKKTWVPIQHSGGKMAMLGKIMGMAAPFALMAVPGLQGAGAGMMMARAGASAGIGALTSKMQGATTGQSISNGGTGAMMTMGNDYFNRKAGR